MHNKIQYGEVSGTKSYDGNAWTALFRITFPTAFSVIPKVFVSDAALNIHHIAVDSLDKTQFRILIYNPGAAGSYNFKFYWLAINL